MASLGRAQVASVSARVETVPVPSSGDAADDMVVWVHPVTPASSLVIGTDKHSGLAVYDLSGAQLQFLPDGDLNNVDLRYGFRLGPSEVALVTSGERSQNLLATYLVDPSLRRLRNVAARSIALGFNVYGCCMYHSHVTGEYYFFGNTDTGHVEQWRLFDNGAGRVDAARVRTFEVGSITEGCVADDENGWLFIAEENVGIWRYGAEPGAGTARVLVDRTGAPGHLTADVEGLSIYYAAGGGGYLLASSQGSSTFVVYDRAPPHGYRQTFQITANVALGIDAVSGTDGIDVVNLALGPSFPSGLFLAQDDSNPGANQNFKLVAWQDVAAAANPPLLVDPVYDALGVHRPATWAYRNGSGVNPSILVNLAPPAIGTTWQSDLDCTGLAPGLALLAWFTRPGAGLFFGPTAEVLVDPTSPLLIAQSAPHSGNVVRFALAVPADLYLCGYRFSLQGASLGGPALVLSNAIDLTIGQ